MINSFNNYLKMGKVKKKTPDPEEANALFTKSQKKLKYIKIKKINSETANFILEDSYEVAREASQSLMSIKGFKPYSHEATISFIKEFYKSKFSEEEMYLFDHFRQLRNNSVYKAVVISENDAKSSLQFAHLFVSRIKSILEKELKERDSK